MYRVRDIVEILTECQEIGSDGYCGFGISENGRFIITLKDHRAGLDDFRGMRRSCPGSGDSGRRRRILRRGDIHGEYI